MSTALASIVRGALAVVARRPGDVHIRLTRDPEVRALNRQWRGIDRATDVLSFAYGETRSVAKGETPAPAPAPAFQNHGPRAAAARVDGDLVISLDRLDEQARRYRVTRGRELARLVVHGALHLAGLDHGRATEREHMRRVERRAMGACAPAIATLDRALDAPVRNGDTPPRRRPPARQRARR